VLKPFMRIGYLPVYGNISFKKLLRFLYFPDAQAGIPVNLMLKKNRH
jgi:hypothetical protein